MRGLRQRLRDSDFDAEAVAMLIFGALTVAFLVGIAVLAVISWI